MHGWRNDASLETGRCNHELERSSGAQQVPMHRLRGAHWQRVGSRPEDVLDRSGFNGIVEDRRGTVRVDIVDLICLKVRRVERRTHGTPLPCLSRAGDVRHVRRESVTGELCVDRGVARPGVLPLLQDHESRALSQHQAGPGLGKGPAGGGRFTRIWRGERAQRLPCTQDAECQGRFGATGNHHIDFTAADPACSLANGHRG